MYLRIIQLLLLTSLTSQADNTLPEVNVIKPKDKTIFHGKHTTVVVDVNPSQVDTIKIQLDNNNTYTIKTSKGNSNYCKSIEIKKRANIITISGYLKNEKVQTSQRKVYFHPELYRGEDEESETYTLDYFHTQENEKKCAKCHNMLSNLPTGDDVLEDVTQASCYTCHKDLTDVKNAHSPAANWRCIDCHNGEVGEYNEDQKGLSKYLVRDPIKESCQSCHEKVEVWDFKPFPHGPVGDGRCIRCHNPHGSNNQFFLRLPIWDLCTTCHAEKATGKHVVSSFVFTRNGGAHPTKSDRPDPARPERTLACSSCHNPHGSSGIYLLRMKGKTPFNVCKRCHQK